MTVKTHASKYHHIEWIDLENVGVLVECAIMKRDPNGNIYFFPLKHLDRVDKRRLYRIITNRNAGMYELWDLMSNVTLGNGMNALSFFHQFVRVITPSGQVIGVSQGQVGAAKGEVMLRPANDPVVPFEPNAGVSSDAIPTEEEIAAAEALLAKVGKVTRKAPKAKSTTQGLKKGSTEFVHGDS